MRAKAAPASTNQKAEGVAVPRGRPKEVEGCRLTVGTGDTFRPDAARTTERTRKRPSEPTTTPTDRGNYIVVLDPSNARPIRRGLVDLDPAIGKDERPGNGSERRLNGLVQGWQGDNRYQPVYARTPSRDRDSRSKWAMPCYGYGGIKRSGSSSCGGEWGRRGADGNQSASWRVVAVDSSAVESPFMAEKTAAMIVYANCLKYPGQDPFVPPFFRQGVVVS
ncbi:hypothetical protein K0M31_014269 [Melipona bicolor]|uniref:Uncharacterized protein n=1 Tax=Melipona bicolor TaxID=60889 RepID=A0AA40KU51_9HYME|nr:hypothetical protein K0M31_014269 [Melipona bicolor]